MSPIDQVKERLYGIQPVGNAVKAMHEAKLKHIIGAISRKVSGPGCAAEGTTSVRDCAVAVRTVEAAVYCDFEHFMPKCVS